MIKCEFGTSFIVAKKLFRVYKRSNQNHDLLLSLLSDLEAAFDRPNFELKQSKHIYTTDLTTKTWLSVVKLWVTSGLYPKYS